jgi:hypothetical protein
MYSNFSVYNQNIKKERFNKFFTILMSIDCGIALLSAFLACRERDFISAAIALILSLICLLIALSTAKDYNAAITARAKFSFNYKIFGCVLKMLDEARKHPDRSYYRTNDDHLLLAVPSTCGYWTFLYYDDKLHIEERTEDELKLFVGPLHDGCDTSFDKLRQKLELDEVDGRLPEIIVNV